MNRTGRDLEKSEPVHELNRLSPVPNGPDHGSARPGPLATPPSAVLSFRFFFLFLRLVSHPSFIISIPSKRTAPLSSQPDPPVVSPAKRPVIPPVASSLSFFFSSPSNRKR
ncbi:hypothetical protein CFOL_v3_32641 [Cephalotus follicularis]|uniref:Uncharacterized protein n=1 Tax=Cephalotus follicularis TaxID=3775 RepID=A0A1Q3DA88_CEPFO|nr:hypothetical protein CFOL_v3_32641 [Cephalotus follicularis]